MLGLPLSKIQLAHQCNILGKVSQITLGNGTKFCAFRLSHYVQNLVKNVEDYLHKKGYKLPDFAKSSWSIKYTPGIDVYPEILPTNSNYLQSLIGILECIFELGILDITMETSAPASMMSSSREGRRKELFHMFAFLKAKYNILMVFDPTKPDIDLSKFSGEDWSETAYGECNE